MKTDNYTREYAKTKYQQYRSLSLYMKSEASPPSGKFPHRLCSPQKPAFQRRYATQGKAKLDKLALDTPIFSQSYMITPVQRHPIETRRTCGSRPKFPCNLTQACSSFLSSVHRSGVYAPYPSSKGKIKDIQPSGECSYKRKPEIENIPLSTTFELTSASDSKRDIYGTKEISAMEEILIHVKDDAQGTRKDFVCDRKILLSEMGYFGTCLKESTSFEDVDILIHCDINIFSWLIKYMKKRHIVKAAYARYIAKNPLGSNEIQLNETNQIQLFSKLKKYMSIEEVTTYEYEQPQLRISNVVQLMISSEYLKMPFLLEECLDFFVLHSQEICSLKLDYSSFNSNIIKLIAKRITGLEIERLHENTEKLKNSLFMKKLELLLEEESNMLYRCVYCCTLFTQEQENTINNIYCYPCVYFFENIFLNSI